MPLGGGVTTIGIPIGLFVIVVGLRADRHLCPPRQLRVRRADPADHRGGRSDARAVRMLSAPPPLGARAVGLDRRAGRRRDRGRRPARRSTSPPSSCSSSSWLATLGITYWAAQRTRSAADFYAAGGGITGFQNGLAIAGDYMSAASFLGISGLVFASGFDGLIYSVGWLVGWPIVLFLIAERLRNLGKFTFADVASFRLEQTPIRILSAIGTLVGGRLLPDRADGRRRQADPAPVRPRLPLRRRHRRRADDRLRRLRRHGGDHLGADHQGLPAARRRHLHGAHGAVALRLHRPRRCSQAAVEVHPEGACRSWRRAAWSPTRSRRSRSAWR